MPKLSIITINYNNLVGLKRTIKSVASQDFKSFEYIVIDGNSTDGSQDLIQQYENTISKWISEADTGVYNAMNKGIDLASGEYVLFLNSGDELYDRDTLLKVYEQLTDTELIAFDIQVIGQGNDFIKQHPDKLSYSYLFDNTLAHQSVFIKRALFEKVGKYDESLKIVSDWKFFIKALVHHSCSYKAVHQILTKYYLDGMSATAEGTFTRRKERNMILERDFSLFYSDYSKLQILESNRFKMLLELENSKVAQKVNSFFLRFFLKIFRSKRLKDL